MKTHKTNKYQLIMLMLVFIVPMLVSWFLYVNHQHFQFKTTNHGMLINPAIPLSSFGNNSEKKWRIVYVVSGACDNHCENVKHNLNQIRLALGKNSKRVIVLIPDNTLKTEITKVLKDNKHQQVDSINKIYLIDPEGNLFMYYPADADPMNILKDLKHVLEVSQIG